MVTPPSRRPSRSLLLAGVLLVASAWVPLILCVFTAPQYPTESPTLTIFAERLTGDTHEFKVLSHYVGIEFPPSVPEMDSGLLKAGIIGLGVIALLASVLSRRLRKHAASLLLISILALGAWGQFRFYQSGHSLDPEAPMRQAVTPFTPPLFGWLNIHRITIYHVPHIGSFLLIGAAASLCLSLRKDRKLHAQTGACCSRPPQHAITSPSNKSADPS